MTRPELLVLTGLHAAGAEAVIGGIRALDPDTTVLHHDLRPIRDGFLRRRLRRGPVETVTTVELDHGCVTCTLRNDLLAALRSLLGPDGPRRVVLHLDPTLDPERICWMVLGEPFDLRGVVAVVDTGRWLADATGDEQLAERGLPTLPGDDRTVAQLAVAQVEFADLVVHTGTADAWLLARTEATLARVAPAAERLRLDGLDERVWLDAVRPGALRGRPAEVHGPLLRGEPPLETDCGIGIVTYEARRPFHPQRLYDAVDVLLQGVVRTRGRCWLASRPDDVLWLESAGGALQVGHAGTWLAGATESEWAAASPDRRAMAALSWDDRFGDRVQELVVVTDAADPDLIAEQLDAALLTDGELAAEESWAALPDPFGRWPEAVQAP
ncbi:GTP-binding protein [Actinomycetes bacterium KLBMP 9759]